MQIKIYFERSSSNRLVNWHGNININGYRRINCKLNKKPTLNARYLKTRLTVLEPFRNMSSMLFLIVARVKLFVLAEDACPHLPKVNAFAWWRSFVATNRLILLGATDIDYNRNWTSKRITRPCNVSVNSRGFYCHHLGFFVVGVN